MLPPATDTEVSLEKDSVAHSVVVTVHDTAVVVKADSVHLHDTVPCPEVDYFKEVTHNNVRATVSLRHGQLDVNCKADSLQKRITWLQNELITQTYKNLKNVRTFIKPYPVEVIKTRLPKWVWWYVCLTLAYFGLKITAGFVKPKSFILSSLLGLFKK